MSLKNYDDSSILITGGTGSFGHKFVDIMLRDHNPRKLIIFSRDELKQHEMRVAGFDHPNLRYFIGDVRDLGRLRRAMRGVDVVVHTAALKQVPACEYNPIEAVATSQSLRCHETRGRKALRSRQCLSRWRTDTVELRTIWQRDRQPWQRDPPLLGSTCQRKDHDHGPANDSFLDHARPGSSIRHLLHRANARRRGFRPQDPEYESHGSRGSHRPEV